MNWKTKMYNIEINTFFILILLILIGCNKSKQEKVSSRVNELPYYDEATFTPKWLLKNSEELKKFHSIPAFSLINQEGDTITEKTFDNKIYVTDFFFTTCPGICPKMTSNMSILEEEFKNDDEILLLSHSVTPDIDSVPVLKSYAIDKKINSKKWHLVTGTRKEIYNLGRNAYYVEEDLGKKKTEDDFLHTENFVLMDKNKHIRGIYNGLNKTDVNQLIADIKTLKLE
jgi:protein SCO1